MVELFRDRIDSVIGTLLLISDGERLCALDYADYEGRMMMLLRRHYREFRLRDRRDPQDCRGRIQAYLAGDLSCLNGIPVNTGGTAFQQEVWSTLRTIPPGAVLSYGEMAARLGRPMSYRAVGMTNALNPVAIVIPCHRLVGVDGALTGYAGGLERKRWLLRHEGVDLMELTSGGTVTKDKRTSRLVRPETERL
jgi:methylated-DNA-[protein]-cysteine S-methyltransferase